MPRAGGVGARRARKRRDGELRRPDPSTEPGASRKKDVANSADNQEKVQKLFEKYDASGNGKLDQEEIRKLLTELDGVTKAGVEPTDEEMDMVLKVADQEEDNCINQKELGRAINVWTCWIKKKDLYEERMKTYDKNGTGTLNKAELKEFLMSLNDGKAVSDEEVEWVMAEADIVGDGQISKTELLIATAEWYVHVGKAKTKSKACAIL
mmetsp:Transcript_39393/g.108537  ORF Transcript_39393/g.108537 Transcript_39393/m.108537 type:complete len:209 (+) Transcript_39393:109-735(+)